MKTMSKYDVVWNVDILPTRIEFQVSDRQTGKILHDAVLPSFIKLNSKEDVEYYVSGYMDIFNYEEYEHKEVYPHTTTYSGKGKDCVFKENN